MLTFQSEKVFFGLVVVADAASEVSLVGEDRFKLSR